MEVVNSKSNEKYFISCNVGDVIGFNNAFYIVSESNVLNNGTAVNAINVLTGALVQFEAKDKVIKYPSAHITLNK